MPSDRFEGASPSQLSSSASHLRETMPRTREGRISVGIFDHTGNSLGGGTLVPAHLAAILSRSYAVELIRDWKRYSLETVASSFSLDLSRVIQRAFDALSDDFRVPGKHSFYQQIRRSRILTEPYDLFIYCGHGVPPFCWARRGLVYCHFPNEFSPGVELRDSAAWRRRNAVDRLMRGRAYQLLWQIRMKRYAAVLANSAFTANWVKCRWGRPAEVLYPPVDLSVAESQKQNVIVSVGRFSANGRSKHQLAQIGAFREFSSNLSADWRIHLIGSCYSPQDKAYLESVRRAAQGLPATFSVNVDREHICRALAEAKLFWHTAGLLNDEAKSPNNAEHFGIATVEAMRAGCVPLVINSGGQREIIQNGASGFLCKDMEELVRNSVAVARDERGWRELSRQAYIGSRAFGSETFERRVSEIVSEWVHTGENCRAHTQGDESETAPSLVGGFHEP